MHWIAPSKKDTAAVSPEKRLWAAAEQFRVCTDVAGLCKAAALREIMAMCLSLNSSHYLGATPGEDAGYQGFKPQLQMLNR